MQEVGVLNSGKKIDYASALRIGTYRGLPTVSHSGSWAGYRAQLLRFPEQKFAVACLCNDGGSVQPEPAARARSRRSISAALMKPEEAAPRREEGAAPAPKYAASGAELQKLAGAYLEPRQRPDRARGRRGQGARRRTRAARSSRSVPTSPGRFRVEGSRDERRGAVRRRRRRPAGHARHDGGPRRPRDRDLRPGRRGVAGPRRSSPSSPATTRARSSRRPGGSPSRTGSCTSGIAACPKDPLVPTVKDAMNLDGMNLRFQRGRGREGHGVHARRGPRAGHRVPEARGSSAPEFSVALARTGRRIGSGSSRRGPHVESPSRLERRWRKDDLSRVRNAGFWWSSVS